MQRPNSIVITTNTTAGPYPLDRYVTGYAIAVQYAGTGTVTCRLQQSFMDPFADIDGNPYSTSYAVSGRFYDVPGFVTVAAASAVTFGGGGTLPLPRALQLITSNVSAANVVWSIVPYGMDGN